LAQPAEQQVSPAPQPALPLHSQTPLAQDSVPPEAGEHAPHEAPAVPHDDVDCDA
jgi:hypothetical protein